MFSFFRRSKGKGLTAEDFVARPDGTILIDVREAEEIAQTGAARGALHIPLAELPLRADPARPEHDPRLLPGARIGLYCVAGARSGQALKLMTRLGYTDVHNIGGLVDWTRAGGTLDR